MSRLVFQITLLVAALFASSSWSATPFCAAGRASPSGFAKRIDPLGAILLRDGRAIHLESIRLPLGAIDHASNSFAQAAHATLVQLTTGQIVKLASQEPDKDRYGRLRAQIFVGRNHLWLQQELLRDGLVRAEISLFHPECAEALYAAEDEARAAKRGLWAASVYAVRSPETLVHDRGTFQIVQGRVVSTAIRKSRAYLDFGEDWRSDFTVTIAPETMRAFRSSNIDPLNYQGKVVRVRGMIDMFHGPEMAISSPASIEIVKAQ